MKLKLLIALVALVPSLVVAQIFGPSAPNPANFGSTGQPGGFQPPPTATTPGQSGATQQQTATNPNKASGSSAGNKETNVGGIYMDFDSSGKSTSTNVGGKVDGHGSSGNSNVKGSNQGSTYTYPCYGAVICN